jgi:hypothetical protein
MISQGSSIERANVVETHIVQRHRKLPNFDGGGRRGLCIGLDEGFCFVEGDPAAIVIVNKLYVECQY